MKYPTFISSNESLQKRFVFMSLKKQIICGNTFNNISLWRIMKKSYIWSINVTQLWWLCTVVCRTFKALSISRTVYYVFSSTMMSMRSISSEWADTMFFIFQIKIISSEPPKPTMNCLNTYSTISKNHTIVLFNNATLRLKYFLWLSIIEQ